MTKDNMDRLMWLRKVLAEGDVDLMREMLKVFAEELMGLKATRSAAPLTVSRARSVPTAAMDTASARSTRGRARSSFPFPNCVKVPTSRTGCFRTAGVRSVRSSP